MSYRTSILLNLYNHYVELEAKIPVEAGTNSVAEKGILSRRQFEKFLMKTELAYDEKGVTINHDERLSSCSFHTTASILSPLFVCHYSSISSSSMASEQNGVNVRASHSGASSRH